MANERKAVHWIKWRTNETIYGSFMTEPISSLGFMVKLCCLSAETRYPGWIQSDPNKGIPAVQLAAMLNVPIGEFQELMQWQKDDGRVKEYEKGMIEIVNWEKYQAIPKWQPDMNISPNYQDDEGSNNKNPYGEFRNVLLTDSEHSKLIERFGENSLAERIETLSAGIASKGYKYKNHYATILAWNRKDIRDKKQTGDAPVKYTKGKYGGLVQIQ